MSTQEDRFVIGIRHLRNASQTIYIFFHYSKVKRFSTCFILSEAHVLLKLLLPLI